jgi:pimeloyl-ACP methyl ester carboxylesterase
MRALVETVELEGCVLRLRTLAPAGRSRDDLAPTVVLVHGIGMSHRSFRGLQRVLSRSYRTIAVDLPGFGGAPRPGRRLEIDDLARLVRTALSDRGVRECIAVGQSMGTQVTVEMALQDPEFVTSVVMIGPVVEEGRRSVLQQALAITVDGFRERPLMIGRLHIDYMRSMPTYLRELGPMMRYDTVPAVAALTVPVLVMRGTGDPVARHDWSERVAGAAREGAFIELPGPHHVQETHPAAASAVIDEFIRVQTVGRLR